MRDPVNAICASKRGNDCACQSRRATYHASEGGKERERWRSSLGTKSRDKRWSGGTRLAKLVAMHDFDSGSELSSPGASPKGAPAEPAADAPPVAPQAPAPESAPTQELAPPPPPKKPRTRPPPEARFAHDMSGWDQLFGPMTQPTPTRAKDATPEQRAAAVEAESARVRESRAHEAEKAREEKAREATERAKEQERHVAAAIRKPRVRPDVPPTERRPQSVTLDVLAEKRRQLRDDMHVATSMDMLSHIRSMHSFEDAMAQDRRALRASKFGAGLQHLRMGS